MNGQAIHVVAVVGVVVVAVVVMGSAPHHAPFISIYL